MRTTNTAQPEDNWLYRLSIWAGVFSFYLWLAEQMHWRAWWLTPALMLTIFLLGPRVRAKGRVINIIALALVATVVPLLLGEPVLGWGFAQTTRAILLVFYGLLFVQVLWFLVQDRAARKRERRTNAKTA